VPDASRSQYATPTPGPCVACMHAPPVHASLPYTGLEIAPLLIVGVLVIVLGLGVRGRA
jgi:hypothetical protein